MKLDHAIKSVQLVASLMIEHVKSVQPVVALVRVASLFSSFANSCFTVGVDVSDTTQNISLKCCRTFA